MYVGCEYMKEREGRRKTKIA